MKRRTLVSGILVAGGVAAGHLLTARFYGSTTPARSPDDFAAAMAGVRLQHVSNELLLKLYSRTVNDQDRQKVVIEVVNHNSNLFVVDANERHHGSPGFYRVAE
ncbi:hypothetical protein [Pseudomonas sp. MF4836]|uniref:hypothetical protein n=1 Tax=Pseudomonas sp. MF4836 TaxID=1960827 RepID=UPI00128FDC4B|nr:hypothetical protein [Pseudomonas sp. MF4836]